MPDGKLPALDGRRVVRALARAGFVVDRVVSSHHMLLTGGMPQTAAVAEVIASRSKIALYYRLI